MLGYIREVPRLAEVTGPDEPRLPVRATVAGRTQRRETSGQSSVVGFACFVAFLVLVAAYATDRGGWVDELGFQNPPYMLAHFGKRTFPSQAANWSFDLPVVTHPPIHTFLIAPLCRLGLSIYYAEASPTGLLPLLTFLCIVRGRFPDTGTLGRLFSLASLLSE